MKKHYVKLITILLVVGLLVGIFSACRSKEGNESQPSGSSKSSTSAKVSPSSAKKDTGTTSKESTSVKSTSNQSGHTASVIDNANGNESASEDNRNLSDEELSVQEQEFEAAIGEKLSELDIDLGGKSIIITVGSTSTSNLPVPSTAESSADNLVWVKKAEAAEKKYNFKFDNRTAPNLTVELAASTLAGVRMTDILFTSISVAFPNYITKDMLLPLDDYLDYENPVIKANPSMYKGTFWKGTSKHYGIRKGGPTKNAGCLLFYNKAILEREGLPDINGLVEQKQWTWENMRNIALYCTKDTNGDGILDQYGIAAKSNWEFVKYILYSNGVTGIDFDSNNKMIYAMNSPQALRALQFTVDLAFVDKVFTASQNPYANGTCAMFVTNDLSANAKFITQGLQSYVSALPMGPDVNDYQNWGNTNFYALSSLCENPGEVAKIFAEISIMWDENLKEIPELVEAKEKFKPDSWLWDPSNGSSRYYMGENEFNIQGMLVTKMVPDYTGGVPNLSSVFNTKLAAPIFSGKMSVNQAVDSIRAEVQSILNEFNN